MSKKIVMIIIIVLIIGVAGGVTTMILLNQRPTINVDDYITYTYDQYQRTGRISINYKQLILDNEEVFGKQEVFATDNCFILLSKSIGLTPGNIEYPSYGLKIDGPGPYIELDDPMKGDMIDIYYSVDERELKSVSDFYHVWFEYHDHTVEFPLGRE